MGGGRGFSRYPGPEVWGISPPRGGYFRRGERPFSVTAKHGIDERRRAQAPWTLWVLLALTGFALVWFAGTLAGLTPLVYHVKWTVYGALFWVLVNLGILAAALSRIRSDRFASERREQQAPELARLTRALFGSTSPRLGKEATVEESAA
jgi:hypothetical protein